jgi:hypothetical protein
MSYRPDFDAVTKGQTTMSSAFINPVVMIIQIRASPALSLVIHHFGSICGPEEHGRHSDFLFLGGG